MPPPAIEGFEFELSRATLCLHRTPHRTLATLCRKRIISDSRGRCTCLGETNWLGLMRKQEFKYVFISVSEQWLVGITSMRNLTGNTDARRHGQKIEADLRLA